MIGFIGGFAAMIAVVTYSLLQSQRTSLFFNSHAFILVGVGTVAIFFLMAPWRDVGVLVDCFRRARKSNDDVAIQKDLIALAKNRRAKLESGHPLLLAAQELWESGLDGKLFRGLLAQRAESQTHRMHRAIMSLRNLAKYPPALGMTGTVIGLVVMFADLSGTQKNKVGISLALAMTATFYGLILANVLLFPLADRLQNFALRVNQNQDEVLRTLFLIEDGQPYAVVEEHLDAQRVA